MSILPKDSFRPNATKKYAIDENPWKPNLTIPTPIIITKTVEVIKTVEVKVTSPQESVDEAQYKAIVKIASTILYIIIGAVASFFVFRFIYRIIMKRRWYKK